MSDTSTRYIRLSPYLSVGFVCAVTVWACNACEVPKPLGWGVSRLRNRSEADPMRRFELVFKSASAFCSISEQVIGCAVSLRQAI